MTNTPTATDPVAEALAANVHAAELIAALKTRDPAEPLRVAAPNTEFDGLVGDMRFTKGVYAGLVDDAAIVYLLNAGYTVEPVPPADDPAPRDQEAFNAAVDAKVAEQIADRLDAAVEGAIKERGLVPKPARKTTPKEGAGQ